MKGIAVKEMPVPAWESGNEVMDTPAYFERELVFRGNGLMKAVQLIDDGFFDNYFLYEKEDEVALGFKPYASVVVTPRSVFLSACGKTEEYRFCDLSATLTKVLGNLKIKNWRAYGIANYALARFNFALPVEPEVGELMELVIPSREMRFYEDRILLRSLKREGLDEMEAIVRSSPDAFSESINARIRLNKIDCKEIHSVNKTHYQTIVAEAIKQIRADRYEKVVLSRRIDIDPDLDMSASFISGRRMNTPKRAYFFKLRGLEVVGFSPETVVEIDKDGFVSTLPLAGTRGMGNNPREKEQLKRNLMKDAKEITEHISTTKYTFEEMKNVCDPDSVGVFDFLSVVERGTVQHLASRVVGKKKPALTTWHVFNSLFPAATSSGAPKKEAIKAIGELEISPRDLYGGCVLTYDYNGTLDSALVLRTVFKQDEKAWLQVGAGIGPFCDPEFEFGETVAKISSVSKRLVRRGEERNEYESF